MRRICVYCGSNLGRGVAFANATRSLAVTLVERGIGVVYGGAGVGLMGILADETLRLGGEIIGVIPESLTEKEVANERLTELHVVRSMHERKALMAELSDGFIALPGGIGTLEEFFEVLTWSQLGLHATPCGLLNVDGYFSSLLAFLDTSVASGFLRAENRAMVLVDAEPPRLLDAFARYKLQSVEKWLDESET